MFNGRTDQIPPRPIGDDEGEDDYGVDDYDIDELDSEPDADELDASEDGNDAE